MRLPFLQLESDIIAHGAAEVSHLARCSIPQALGHIAMVRAWAVSHATDEAPPDGWIEGDSAGRRIEAAAHWTGDKGALLQALADAGHVREEPGGIRVLHLEPYVQAWEKNRTAKERMRTLRERSANKRERSGRHDDNDHERSAKFGQQTQTYITTTPSESSASPTSAAAESHTVDDIPDATDDAHPVEERPALVLTTQEAKKRERKPSAGEALYFRLEDRRKKACEEAGRPFIPAGWSHSRMNRDLGPIARAESANPEAWERFKSAWLAFITDEVPGRAAEPWPLDWFWARRAQYEARGTQAEEAA